MPPLVIVVYLRTAPNDFVVRHCLAVLTNVVGDTITFHTDEWLSPGLGLSYYVMTKPQGAEPAQFRQMEIYPNEGVAAPYTYTLPLGIAWTGTVAE